MSLVRTVEEIRSLKIQGAEVIAKRALSELSELVHQTKAKTKLELLRKLSHAKTLLEHARPTEPCLRNVLEYVFRHSTGSEVRSLKESFLKNIHAVSLELAHAEQAIEKIGSVKIQNGMVVFTHCHSSTVMSILKAAKDQGKTFEVHSTETRPHLQGRKTARELGSYGIKVLQFVDSAARLALKNADLMLIGCDAFTSEGKVINKMGSELFAEIAHRMQVPVYVCTTTWKFDPKTVFGFEEQIEQRSSREVWDDLPKNVRVDNHAFEKISPELITGMVTEIGVYRPEVLVEELRTRQRWMFD